MVIGLIDPLWNFVGALCGVGAIMFVVLAAMMMFSRLAARIITERGEE